VASLINAECRRSINNCTERSIWVSALYRRAERGGAVCHLLPLKAVCASEDELLLLVVSVVHDDIASRRCLRHFARRFLNHTCTSHHHHHHQRHSRPPPDGTAEYLAELTTNPPSSPSPWHLYNCNYWIIILSCNSELLLWPRGNKRWCCLTSVCRVHRA